jgi:hypothetical protein
MGVYGPYSRNPPDSGPKVLDSRGFQEPVASNPFIGDTFTGPWSVVLSGSNSRRAAASGNVYVIPTIVTWTAELELLQTANSAVKIQTTLHYGSSSTNVQEDFAQVFHDVPSAPAGTKFVINFSKELPLRTPFIQGVDGNAFYWKISITWPNSVQGRINSSTAIISNPYDWFNDPYTDYDGGPYPPAAEPVDLGDIALSATTSATCELEVIAVGEVLDKQAGVHVRHDVSVASTDTLTLQSKGQSTATASKGNYDPSSIGPKAWARLAVSPAKDYIAELDCRYTSDKGSRCGDSTSLSLTVSQIDYHTGSIKHSAVKVWDDAHAIVGALAFHDQQLHVIILQAPTILDNDACVIAGDVSAVAYRIDLDPPLPSDIHTNRLTPMDAPDLPVDLTWTAQCGPDLIVASRRGARILRPQDSSYELQYDVGWVDGIAGVAANHSRVLTAYSDDDNQIIVAEMVHDGTKVRVREAVIDQIDTDGYVTAVLSPSFGLSGAGMEMLLVASWPDGEAFKSRRYVLSGAIPFRVSVQSEDVLTHPLVNAYQTGLDQHRASFLEAGTYSYPESYA